MKKLLIFRFEILLTILVVGYIALFSYLSIHRYQNLHSHYYDLGIMHQTVYNTSRGHFLEMTNQDYKTNMSRFAIHFDPILVIFVPLYWLKPVPEILLIAQSFALGLGGLAVYMIAHYILTRKFYALLFAISYLLYYPVQRANLFDFHPVVLATTFILFALYFGLVRRHGLALIFIILALLTKENVGLVTFLYGIYLFFSKKERKWGLLTAVTSLAFFGAAFFYIIPYFRPESGHFALRYLEGLGDSPISIMTTLLFHPIKTATYLFTLANSNYISALFLSHIVFVVFAPTKLLIALPEFALNLLSSNNNMKSIYFHYNSVLIPFIYLSAISGFSWIIYSLKNKKIEYLWLFAFIGLTIYQFYLYSPLPLPFLKEPQIISKIDPQKERIIHDWRQRLQNDTIKVSTTPKLAPFFTARRYYYNFLFDPAFSTFGIKEEEVLKNINIYQEADFVLIDRTDLGEDGSLPRRYYAHLKNNRTFNLIYNVNDIEVYKKL